MSAMEADETKGQQTRDPFLERFEKYLTSKGFCLADAAELDDPKLLNHIDRAGIKDDLEAARVKRLVRESQKKGKACSCGLFALCSLFSFPLVIG